MTPADMLGLPAPDGKTYLTGWRIQGQHCGECGCPDSTRDDFRDGMWISRTTPCCTFPHCSGYVATTPWTRVDTGEECFACCLGEAQRRLGGRAINHLGKRPTDSVGADDRDGDAA